MLLFPGVCKPEDFNCGDGFCTDTSVRCNGFKDCVINYEDEIDCGKNNWILSKT